MSQKMALWVGAQGQVHSAKKSQKHAPILTSPTENLEPKTKKIFRWFEQLSSSIGWRVIASQTWSKQWPARDGGYHAAPMLS